MKIEINDIALSKKFVKLINKLIKTANKYSGLKLNKTQVSISFVEKKQIKKLNKEFRNIDKETDVLSFPTLDIKPGQKVRVKDYKNDINPQTKKLMLGDIIICEEVAKEHAKEYNHSFEREVCYLVVHGFLHLIGYDHMEEEDKIIMRAYEEAVLSKYKITRDF